MGPRTESGSPLLRVKVRRVGPGAALSKNLRPRPGAMAKPVVSQRPPTNKHFTDVIFISEWPLLTKEEEAEWTGDISRTYWSLA